MNPFVEEAKKEYGLVKVLGVSDRETFDKMMSDRFAPRVRKHSIGKAATIYRW
jgi:hypothetical protein